MKENARLYYKVEIGMIMQFFEQQQLTHKLEKLLTHSDIEVKNNLLLRQCAMAEITRLYRKLAGAILSFQAKPCARSKC